MPGAERDMRNHSEALNARGTPGNAHAPAPSARDPRFGVSTFRRFGVSGFSLVEMLVVIVVIVVLAALATPAINHAFTLAMTGETTAFFASLEAACEAYFHDKGFYPGSADAEDAEESVELLRNDLLTPTYAGGTHTWYDEDARRVSGNHYIDSFDLMIGYLKAHRGRGKYNGYWCGQGAEYHYDVNDVRYWKCSNSSHPAWYYDPGSCPTCGTALEERFFVADYEDGNPADWQQDAEEYLVNATTDMPWRYNTFVLLSAGPDGEFGTADDITNFK